MNTTELNAEIARRSRTLRVNAEHIDYITAKRADAVTSLYAITIRWSDVTSIGLHSPWVRIVGADEIIEVRTESGPPPCNDYAAAEALYAELSRAWLAAGVQP